MTCDDETMVNKTRINEATVNESRINEAVAIEKFLLQSGLPGNRSAFV